jgi:radical SAM superfamily enzyme YgiQ (UPF0313 family)
MGSTVLLVNPGNQRAVYQDLSEGLTALDPPIWCRLFSSYLRTKGAAVEILDAETLGLSADDAAAEVAAVNPVLTVIVVHGHQPSASTQKMPAAAEICKSLKATTPHIPVLIVGGHPAALPERSLTETGADFVCTGEGPYTIWELLRCLSGSTGWRDRLKDVRGLCFMGETGPVKTQPTLNVQKLDEEMPGGCWNLLPMDQYRAHNWHCFQEKSRQPYASIYTSLNCPYSCEFCMIASPFREGDGLRAGPEVNLYRTWSPEATVREIETVVENYGVTNIRFADEMFILNERHTLGICDKIIERGYGDRLNIWCYGRVDQTKEKFLEKLRRSGFKWICLGIESFSEYVRDGVDKNEYGVKDIIDTCKRIQNHDINIIANFIFGLPDDTMETMQQTLDISMELNTEFANFYCAVPYPGSKLYDIAVKEGWELPRSWIGYSFHAYEHLPLPTRTLSAAEVLRFRDKAFQQYFTNPSYLAYVGRRFGQGVVEEIKTMTQKKLKRKLLGD